MKENFGNPRAPVMLLQSRFPGRHLRPRCSDNFISFHKISVLVSRMSRNGKYALFVEKVLVDVLRAWSCFNGQQLAVILSFGNIHARNVNNYEQDEAFEYLNILNNMQSSKPSDELALLHLKSQYNLQRGCLNEASSM